MPSGGEPAVVAITRRIQRAALIVATLSSFLGPFMGSSVNVALPSIGQEFGMGAVLLGWVNTSFLLAAAVFLIPFGRLGDIYGRKRIYLWGALLFVLASVLIAQAGSGQKSASKMAISSWRAFLSPPSRAPAL